MPEQDASTPVLANADDADRMFAALQARAAQQGVALRAPPPHPTTCCGRGCNGCVWEGFMDAALFWREDALAALNFHHTPVVSKQTGCAPVFNGK